MSTTFWMLLTIFAVVAGLGIFIALVASFIRLRWHEIPEEERWVIYRLGRFNRIAGPGWTFIPARLEEVKKKFNVRPHPIGIAVHDLLMYGTPFGYSLNFWLRTDLLKAAQMIPGNEPFEDKLTRLITFSDAEIHQEVVIKTRKAFQEVLGQYERDNPLPNDADFVQTLLPVIPGLPTCDRILKEVQNRLEKSLPSIGVFLDTLHPLTVTSLHLGSDIITSFSRSRMARIIRRTFPGMSDQELMLTIERAIGEPPYEQRFYMAGEGGGAASVEMRDEEENRRFKFYTGTARASSATTESQASPAPKAPKHEPLLTDEDLRILKRVPRAASGGRTT